jgi:hypothetical protein
VRVTGELTVTLATFGCTAAACCATAPDGSITVRAITAETLKTIAFVMTQPLRMNVELETYLA